jgi:hypothetical protein
VTLRSALGGGDLGSEIVLGCAFAAYVASGLIAMLMAKDRLGPDGTRPADTMRGVALGLAEGVRELRLHGEAGRAIAVVGVHRFAFGVLTAGGLLLVRYALNEFAVLTGAAAAGALIGAILTPGASRRWGSVAWSAAALAQAGVVGIGLVIAGATLTSLPLLLLGTLSIGFAGQAVKVCSDTLVQRFIPDDHLGRVFALFDMIVNVCLVTGITVMAIGSRPALWYRRHGPRRVRVTVNGGN